MKNTTSKQQPRYTPWEEGEFMTAQKIGHRFSDPFLMLCKLAGIGPRQIIIDFADNLACSSWKRKGREAARKEIADYFMAQRYGQEHYSPDEITEMFRDMEAVGRLFPHKDPEMIELYVEWRDRHDQYWFDKWYHQHRRT